MAELIDAGVLQTTLGEHFGRIDAANLRRAHALLESHRARGKIVLGLSTQRWRSTPGTKPALPHLAAWFERLRGQPGFTEYVDNGVA